MAWIGTTARTATLALALGASGSTMAQCTPVFEPGDIGTSGCHFLVNDIAGPIALQASDTSLDLNGYTMLDGATIVDVAPSLLMLTALSVLFLGLGARFFRWTPN